MPEATDTQSEYVIITAFPRRQRLRERAAILRLYVYCFSPYCSLYQREREICVTFLNVV